MFGIGSLKYVVKHPRLEIPTRLDWIIEILSQTSQIGNSHMFGIGSFKYLVKLSQIGNSHMFGIGSFKYLVNHPRLETPTCLGLESNIPD